MPIQEYSGNYFIHMLEDLYKKSGVQPPQADMDTLKRLVDEECTREEYIKTWVRPQDSKIAVFNLDIPIGVIYSQTLSENVANIEMKVPPNYKHLLMMGSGKTDNAAYNDYIVVRFNDDSSASYRAQYNSASNATVGANQETAETDTILTITTGTSADSASVGSFFSVIPHYQSLTWKVLIGLNGTGQFSSTALYSIFNVGFWQNTSPIEKITIRPLYGSNIVSGCSITVLGIK